MRAPKHTLGPWHVGADGTIVFDKDGWGVASATTFHGRHNGPESAKTNGRLIAAAPELLRVAQMLVEANSPEAVASATQQAHYAIAKATGSDA